MKDWLLPGFDYDLWANLKWLNVMGEFKNKDRAQKVLDHILVAQRLWLDRIDGDTTKSLNEYETLVADESQLKQAVDDWKSQLAKTSLDHAFHATRMDGTKWEFTFGQTARHVLNHGTYHRGHLRGLADAEGWDGFEDTDWSAWLRDNGVVKQVG